MKMPSVLIRPKLNYHSILVEKVSFQAFPLIFKDQYSEIFGRNIRIIFGIQNYHESNMNINIRRKIFEYSNIFEDSFEH